MFRSIHPGAIAQRSVNRQARSCLRAVKRGNTARQYELSTLQERQRLGRDAAHRGWTVSPDLVERFEVEAHWFMEYPDEDTLENLSLEWAQRNLRDATRGWI